MVGLQLVGLPHLRAGWVSTGCISPDCAGRVSRSHPGVCWRWLYGWHGRVRTSDLAINSRLLYLLSYMPRMDAPCGAAGLESRVIP